MQESTKEQHYTCSECGERYINSFDAYYCCINLDYTEIEQGCSYECDKCGNIYQEEMDVQKCCLNKE